MEREGVIVSPSVMIGGEGGSRMKQLHSRSNLNLYHLS